MSKDNEKKEITYTVEGAKRKAELFASIDRQAVSEKPMWADFVDEEGELDIVAVFFHLTNFTTPGGNITHHRELLESFGCGLDKFGNMALDLTKDKDGNRISSTLFVAHFDTVGVNPQPIQHMFTVDDNDDLHLQTDGKTILGADDKSGMTVLLNLIHNRVPGYYYFFRGEETGAAGSRQAAGHFRWSDWKRCVAFDRFGTSSIITHQRSKRSCSDLFAKALADDFKTQGLTYTSDDGGSFTDSASFFDEIPECTNISVGYYNQHGVRESQNMGFLSRLCDATTKIAWEELPTDEGLLKTRPGRSYGGNYSYVAKKTTLADLDKMYDTGTLVLTDVEKFLKDNASVAARMLVEYLYSVKWPDDMYVVDDHILRVGDVVEFEKREWTVTGVGEFGIRMKEQGHKDDKFIGVVIFRNRAYKFLREAPKDETVSSN